MRTCAELNVLPAKGCDLAIPDACLNGDEQQRLITPSDPCARIRSRDKGDSLFICQKLHGTAFVAL
jgi:hypothetical protein